MPTDKVAGELARYFQAPVAVRAGAQGPARRSPDAARPASCSTSDDQAAALDVFDRVLTIDPKNAKVLAILDGINRRARLKTVGLARTRRRSRSAAARSSIHLKTRPPPPEAPPEPISISWSNMFTGPATNTTKLDPLPPEIDAGITDPADAGPAIAIIDPDHRVAILDAGLVVEERHLQINVFPKQGTTIQFDDGPAVPVPNGSIDRALTKKLRIHAHNDLCSDGELDVDPADPALQSVIMISLQFKPAQIVPHCPNASSVRVNGKQATLDQPSVIAFDSNATFETKPVKVEFIIEKPSGSGGSGGSGTVPVVTGSTVKVTAGKKQDVQCEQP